MAEHSESKPPTFHLGLDRPDRVEKLDQFAEDLCSLSRPETDHDPLFQTMQLWTEAQKSPESLRELLRRLRPVHGYSLEHVLSTPFGFPRLVLETARNASREGHETGLESLRSGRYYAETLPIESEADRRAAQDLRILASAYWAEALLIRRHLPQAEEALNEAEAQLDGETDDEVRVTVAEIRAAWLQVNGDPAAAAAHLDRAARGFPRHHPMPGRWSQLLLHRGRHHLAAGSGHNARSCLLNALESCPEDRALCTRYQVLHLLAATEINLGRYEQARRYLEVTGTLEAHGQPRRHGQRFWMLGYIASKLELPGDAGDQYLQAFLIFQELEHFKDAARVLRDLAEHYVSRREFHQVSWLASLLMKADWALQVEVFSLAAEMKASALDRFLEEMEALEKAEREEVH